MTWKLCRDTKRVPSIDATYGLISKTTNGILGVDDKPETYIISCHGDKGIAPTEIAFFADIQRNGMAIGIRLSIFNAYLHFTFKKLGLGSPYLFVKNTFTQIQKKLYNLLNWQLQQQEI